MLMSVAVMVSVDRREVYELMLPGISSKSFRGISLAELLDDVALHLMEKIPQESGAKMARYQFCPHISLRRVKITTNLEIPGTKKKKAWTGRLTAVVSHWPDDDFFVVWVPRLGVESFAVARTAYLEEGLTRFVENWARRKHYYNGLDAFTSGSYEYLEILQVDTELPSVLPSRPPKRKKIKKKKTHLKKKKKKKIGQSAVRKRRLVPPVTLRQVSVNLTHRAIDGRLGRTFGRKALIDQIAAQLQREGAAVLLVGPQGVGKTAIIHEIVRRMATENRDLHARSDVWAVDGNRIIAGMSMVGAWEQRCERMVGELSARQDILYVDDLPSLVYTGRSAHSDTNVAQYLVPHLARGELRIIGECTPERLEATREEAPGFFARFHVVQIPEMDERDALMVLVHAMRQMESSEQVAIEPEVMETALALTRRFMVGRCYPGKAIDLLRQTVADYRDVERDDYGRRRVTRNRLVDLFSRQTGLPAFILWEQQARRHAEILAHFGRRIVAQPAASSAVSDIVTTLQQGLNDPHRPLSTMLFVGPTGVGKTETAKALAEFLFGGAERLIRFDMSEFREPWSVVRLFGDRLRPEGELTRRVAQQPFSVVLFDEIEKAHPAVFDALLQVLGEGRLTNAAGRTTDFCNTVLIMTSNLGVRDSQRHVGFGEPSAQTRDVQFYKAAEDFFRPEFFNRIDRIVAFRSLGRDAIAPLVRRLLQEILGRRGLRRSGVLVQVEPELVELLIDQGFEPRYGARSLKRALEQRLTIPLAQHLVTHPVDRTTLVHLYRAGEEIGMDINALEDRPLPPAPPALTTRGWPALEEGHKNLSTSLETLRKGEEGGRLEGLQASMLARFNEEALQQGEEWARLGSVSELVQQMRTLAERLMLFEDDYLTPYEDMESFDMLRRWEKSKRPVQAPTEQALATDRALIQRKARKVLDGLEQDFAALHYRCGVIHDTERPLLVRLLPATDDDTAVVWAGVLAASLGTCWGQWCVAQHHILGPEGWAPTEVTLDPSGALRVVLEERPVVIGLEEGLRGVRAFAIELHGPGMRPLVAQEEGFHMSTAHSGPDMLIELVRVEEVGEGHTPSVERLEALDALYLAWRRARLEGLTEGLAVNPLPPLHIARRFDGGTCRDPETGVEMKAGPSLGEHLFDVLLRRLQRAARLDKAKPQV